MPRPRHSSNPWEIEEEYDVVIIGAGFAGSFTAIEIAKRGLKILVIDPNSELIGTNSSSNNECFKLHTGAHYIGDMETAEKCLRDSVAFAREFPGFLLGQEGQPWRRGRHYIMSNSIVPPKIARERLLDLQQIYKTLVEENPNNQVFGSPTSFLRFLEKSEHTEIASSIPFTDKDNNVSQINIALAVETPESQVDINKVRRHLTMGFKRHPNISHLSGHKVETLTFSPNDLDYYVQAINVTAGGRVRYKTKAIINCAWQNAEFIDTQLGYYIPDDRIIRVKASVLVELPPTLTNIHTCIGSIGPHFSITNLGDETAVITYEPVTNVGFYRSGDKINDPFLKEVMKGNLSLNSGAGKTLTDNIMKGVALYVPELKQATPQEIRVGYVKTFVGTTERYSLYDSDSPIHRRREDGVETAGLCYLRHSAMKMTYSQENARKISVALAEHLVIREKLLALILAVKNQVQSLLPSYSTALLLYHVFRDFLLENIHITFSGLAANGRQVYSPRKCDQIAKSIQYQVLAKAAPHEDIKAGIRGNGLFRLEKTAPNKQSKYKKRGESPEILPVSLRKGSLNGV